MMKNEILPTLAAHNPPYFCKKLNYTTHEDMEIRLKSDVYLCLVKFYV